MTAAKTGIGGIKERRLDGKKIEKPNSLKQYIFSIPIDIKRGGGFYSLQNIKATNDTFLDIEIMIEGGILDKKDRNMLNKWQRLSLRRS